MTFTLQRHGFAIRRLGSRSNRDNPSCGNVFVFGLQCTADNEYAVSLDTYQGYDTEKNNNEIQCTVLYINCTKRYRRVLLYYFFKACASLQSLHKLLRSSIFLDPHFNISL